MRRPLLLLATTLTLATAAMLTPTTALAADSTCTIHELKATSWSIQSDQVNTSWDFKCGGANNENYGLILSLQWKDSGGAWHTFDCDNGAPCQVARPTGQAEFTGGTEHSGTNTWNIAGQLNCLDIRFHGRVVFYGSSPDILYNSLTYNIGC